MANIYLPHREVPLSERGATITHSDAFFKRGLRILFPLILTVLSAAGVLFASSAPAYERVPALIDLRTTFSDGAYDPDTLVRMAVKKGFSVIVFNDHDRMVLEYGLPPFRNILKKKEERNSIAKAGADAYLRTIRSLRKKYPDVVLIPGAESTPFYYWTGSLFSRDLTANDHERRILTMGLEKPADYEGLPVIHSPRPMPDIRAAMPALAAFGLSFLIALFFLFQSGWWRLPGIALALVNACFLADIVLSKPAAFDAYHGKQGAAPYQLFIDAAGKAGGLTFWNYPETHSGVSASGPIRFKTLPFPEMLLDTKNYTGFAALYGDRITITEPGNVWDTALNEYCRGLRQRPPWGIAAADFHREGDAGQNLGDFQTVLWLTGKTQQSVLTALKNGKMYACQGKFPHVPKLDEFSISAAQPDTATRAISGDELLLERNPRIRITVSGTEDGAVGAESSGKSKKTVQVRLIRSGKLIQMFSGALPLSIDFTDTFEAPGEMVSYRMDMTGDGIIVSNPIFVKFMK